MTATNKLPPLAEALRDIAKRQKPHQLAPLAEALVDLADDLAPRYDERIAELEELAEKRREEAWAWMKVANERGQEITKLKDELAVLNHDFAERMEKFRELAREAHASYNRPGAYISPEDSGFMERLAAMHKEE